MRCLIRQVRIDVAESKVYTTCISAHSIELNQLWETFTHFLNGHSVSRMFIYRLTLFFSCLLNSTTNCAPSDSNYYTMFTRAVVQTVEPLEDKVANELVKIHMIDSNYHFILIYFILYLAKFCFDSLSFSNSWKFCKTKNFNFVIKLSRHWLLLLPPQISIINIIIIFIHNAPY